MAFEKFSQFTAGGDLQYGDVVVGLRDGENYKFNSPGEGIKDQYGNYLLKYTTTSTSSADGSCYPSIISHTTAAGYVTYTANGSPSDIGITISSKGLQGIELYTAANDGNATTAGKISFNNTDEIVGFSNDVTLADNTHPQYFCPTQYAVKAYVDSQIGGVVDSISGVADRITISGTASDPVVDIASTYVGQASITTLGTITTGTWNGSLLASSYGGTGVNNGGSTLTLGGNLVTSGAFDSTFTMTGATNVTFPTTGTLATTTGSITTATNLAGGTANDIPYQTAAGTTSFITETANGVLVYSGAGVPSSSTTLPSGLTIPSATLTGPATLISYVNNTQYVEIGTITNAAFLDFHSDDSGVSVDYDARILSSGGTTGTDGQATLSFLAASFNFNNQVSSGNAGGIRGGFILNGNTSGSVSIRPQVVAGTYNFNLPIDAGTAGQALMSGGGASAPMTWLTATSASTASTLMTRDGTGGTNVTLLTFPSTIAAKIALTSSAGFGIAGNSILYYLGTNSQTHEFGFGTAAAFTSRFRMALDGTGFGIYGTTSGIVNIAVSPVAGVYNFNLPIAAGSAGQFLTSQAGGSNAMTWTSPATSIANLSGGVLGSVPYQSAVDTTSFVAPNITTTTMVLTQTGDGTNGALPAWITATDLNTASAIVRRNASGNFSGGTITANALLCTTALTFSSATGDKILLAGAATSGLGVSSTAMLNFVQLSTQFHLFGFGSSASFTERFRMNMNGAGLGISGSTSGSVTIAPQAAAGTYNFNLPITAGTAGQVLTSAGGAAAPMTWTDAVSVIGTINGTTASANGAAIVGNTLYMQNASATVPGLVSTAAQTFTGAKTILLATATPLTINTNGDTSRIHMSFVNSSANANSYIQVTYAGGDGVTWNTGTAGSGAVALLAGSFFWQAGSNTLFSIYASGFAMAQVGIGSGYTSTVTSGTPVVLTTGSTQNQDFTGSAAQTVTMPVTTTMRVGYYYTITNNSTNNVTLNSSGGNTILVMAPGTESVVKCILASGTTAASWMASYRNISQGPKTNGTEAANAVTASGTSGLITTSSLTTAAGSSYVITWTNTFITTNSIFSFCVQGGTNTAKHLNFECVAGSGTATLTINNIGAVAALNGTLIIGYMVR